MCCVGTSLLVAKPCEAALAPAQGCGDGAGPDGLFWFLIYFSALVLLTVVLQPPGPIKPETGVAVIEIPVIARKQF